MRPLQAYQTKSISESITGFAQFLRMKGFNIGLKETIDAMQVASYLIQDKPYFKGGLKAIFCQSPEERKVFDTLFYLYWDTNPIDHEEQKNMTTTQGRVQKKTNPSIAIMGFGKTDQNKEESKQVSGANETERLKKTDLAFLGEVDTARLNEIALQLIRQMAMRMKRRKKKEKQNGQINLRKTLRKSLTYGGEPIDLIKKSKIPKRQRLLVFLDVSGSMDKYSLFLLRFICILKENFRQMDAFLFSTSLIRITRVLQIKNLDVMFHEISQKATMWSSGTKIGECFSKFNEQYGKQMLNGSPVVLILSDGLETGDEKELTAALKFIEKRSKKIIWLNPLKGMKGFEPKTKGMLAALPSVDSFISAHNLDSLLELENILNNA